MRGLLAIALLTFAAAQTQAAETKRPDLSGFWQLIVEKKPGGQALIDALPKDVVLLDDTGPREFGPGEFGGLKPKPHALKAAQSWSPKDALSREKTCVKPSIVYAMQGPFPMEIHQATELIVFRLEYFELTRVIFMDGRPHPPADAPHSKTGHSVGRWEGDVLVVETTHLAPATITNNGLDHSDKIRVIERFQLSPDGTRLWATQLYEDPENLENRGARYMAWKRVPGQYIFPYECDPTYGDE